MNTKNYRLIRDKHFRTAKQENDPTPILTKFVRGDVLVPTDEELRTLRHIFEGPLEDDAEATEPGAGTPAVPAAPTLSDKATLLLKSPEANIRDSIRQADADLLEAMLQSEGQRQPQPRKKVMELVMRRKKALGAGG